MSPWKTTEVQTVNTTYKTETLPRVLYGLLWGLVATLAVLCLGAVWIAPVAYWSLS